MFVEIFHLALHLANKGEKKSNLRNERECAIRAYTRDYSNIYENLEQKGNDDKMHHKKFSKQKLK